MDYSYITVGTSALLVVILIIYLILSLRKNSRIRKKLNADTQKVEWLAVSREQFKRIFNEAPVPYLILDTSGKIQEINKAGLRFFGVTPEEIVTVNLFSLMQAEDDTYIGYVQTCCERGIPVDNKEVKIVQKGGTIRWIKLSILRVSDSKDNHPPSLATLFDITEQKNLDQTKTEFVSLASHQSK